MKTIDDILEEAEKLVNQYDNLRLNAINYGEFHPEFMKGLRHIFKVTIREAIKASFEATRVNSNYNMLLTAHNNKIKQKQDKFLKGKK